MNFIKVVDCVLLFPLRMLALAIALTSGSVFVVFLAAYAYLLLPEVRRKYRPWQAAERLFKKFLGS